MKTFLTAAILGLTGLAGAVTADAQDYRRHSPGNAPRTESRHEPRYEPRRESGHRGFFGLHFGFAPRPAPRVERVWVAPRYETIIVGYECGRPVYRTVCAAEGYWTTRACD